MCTIKMVAVVLALLSLAACKPTNQVPKPPTVTVSEGQNPGNLQKPTRLDVILKDTGDPGKRCDEMGGVLNMREYPWVCENVDY